MAEDDYELETFAGRVRAIASKAILFYVNDAEEEIWFPLSEVELDENGRSLDVPRWLARDRGLI
jgi:hypothetical protein